MIALTKYITATGEIFGRIFVAGEQDAMLNTFSLEPGQALIEGEFDEATHYVLDDVATPRPNLELPTTHTLPAGDLWSVPNVPAGTIIEFDGTEVGTVDETGLGFTIQLAGVWRVTLKPPFPWIEASCEVTVT